MRRYDSLKNGATGLVVFITTFLVFFFSPVRQIADSNYSMLLSHSLLEHRSFALDGYGLPHLPPKPQEGYLSNGDCYQLELVEGHLYYYFPPGTSVLSEPFVAFMNRAGISAISPKGAFDEVGEVWIETRLAALLMAALCSVIFLTGRLLLPLRWSLIMAYGSGFGTQIWSTTSRGMWSDTWGSLLLGLVVLLLTGVETKRWTLRPVMLGTLMSWLYFVRPTYSIPIAAITIYVLLYHRSVFLGYAVTGLLWLAGFLSYSQYHFHQMLPHYYQVNRLTFPCFWQALAGNLISPARGLLIFAPVLLFIAYLLIRYRRAVLLPRLVALSTGIILVHLAVISGFAHWYGGFCYGPRLTAGLVPWFALLGILAVHAKRQRGVKERKNRADVSRTWDIAEWIVGALLLASSIALNGKGAVSESTARWNAYPVSVDEKPERLWDWNHPQFLAR